MKGVISIFSFKKINKHNIKSSAVVPLSAAIIFTCVTCFGASNTNKGINIANAKQIYAEATTTSTTEIPTTTITTAKTAKPTMTTTKTSSTTDTTTTTSAATTQTITVSELATTQSESSASNEPEYQECSFYGLSKEDMNMMCTIVSSETGYCEDQAQKAVAHTIINRLISDKFPNDMYSVCTQENQYTAIHSYFDGQYRAGLAPGSDGWNHTMQLCYEALNESDFTNGAYAYYNPNICGYNSWFESLNLVYIDQYGRFFNW